MNHDDMTLVREFAASNSEPAFAALVERHIGLIHSAARRQVGDDNLAEEITQAVFIILSRKAAALGPKTILSAWLYRTTCYAAADALKTRRRRHAREQEAFMQSILNETTTEEAWTQLAPLLDDALNDLGEADRTALVLRYFENKSAAEIAQALRMKEDAAQKRVVRALEKLRARLLKRGVTLTATVIASAVAANSVQAAPVGLVVKVAALAAKGSIISITLKTLVKGTMKMMNYSKIKTAIAIGAGILFVAGTATALLIQDKNPSAATLAAGQKIIADKLATPLDLTTNYTTPADYFPQITRFPGWKTVPTGFQTFAHVPLQIGGMICLWGGGNATNLHIIFPEQRLGIAVNQKFETLYVYHGCFFRSPDGTPVCDVVFRYQDGSSATNQMRYGSEFLDWIAGKDRPDIGPTGEDSTLAWFGGSSSTNSVKPLRFCLTAIDNPQPTNEVSSIDLFSCKSRTAPCIMAMTIGKSRLLEHNPEVQQK